MDFFDFVFTILYFVVPISLGTFLLRKLINRIARETVKPPFDSPFFCSRQYWNDHGRQTVYAGRASTTETNKPAGEQNTDNPGFAAQSDGASAFSAVTPVKPVVDDYKKMMKDFCGIDFDKPGPCAPSIYSNDGSSNDAMYFGQHPDGRV